MDPHSDFDIEDMEEIAENMGRTKRQAGPGKPIRPVVIVLIVIGLTIVFLLFFRGGNGMVSEEIAAITERLNRIEQKQQLYEEFVKNTGDFTNRLHELDKSISEVQGRNESLANEIHKINDQLALLNNKIVSASKTTASPVPAQKKTTATTRGHYHQVTKGETLYGISKKYGLSVDELRSLNHLSKNAAIHPGQKLVVK